MAVGRRGCVGALEQYAESLVRAGKAGINNLASELIRPGALTHEIEHGVKAGTEVIVGLEVGEGPGDVACHGGAVASGLGRFRSAPLSAFKLLGRLRLTPRGLEKRLWASGLEGAALAAQG